MTTPPWDQRLARRLVRPLARTPLRPSHLTTLSLLLALFSGGLFATGQASAAGWAAVLFALARFLDHADGELARLTNRRSRFGYYYDFVVGGLSSAALFAGLGVGLSGGGLGRWTLVMGLLAAAGAIAGTGFGLALEALEPERAALYYPTRGGFELEDGIYLIVPIAWLGWLAPFLLLAGLGQLVFTFWLLVRYFRMRASGRASVAGRA